MTKEKQIDEMAKALCERCNDDGTCFHDGKPCDLRCGSATDARFIYDKGYRKASDVALEVINTALSKIQIMISAIKALEESGNITEFNGGAKSALEIVFKDLAELKKKYESEKDDGN